MFVRIVCCGWQRQLEDNFFRRHPASLRRTADFIAERVASNAVKKLQQNALKDVMAECQQWALAETTSHLATTPADMLVSLVIDINYWHCLHYMQTLRSRVYENFECLSVSQCHHLVATHHCGGVAVVSPAGMRYQLIAARPACSNKCKQCLSVSWHWKLNTTLLFPCTFSFCFTALLLCI